MNINSSKLTEWVGRELLPLLILIRTRFIADSLLRVAASLSYTSLLSLVPLISISFAAFSAFPVFSPMRKKFETFILDNLLPEQGHSMFEHLDQFLANAGSLTAIGIVGLAITALLLLNTIETIFNQIFRVKNKRPVLPRLLMLWTVLSFGPILLGGSISLSTTLFAYSKVGTLSLGGFDGFLISHLPFVLIWLALLLFYTVIPYRKIHKQHAMFGALIATILFSLLRWAFATFMTGTSTYSVIYGAAASIPIFLVWMYLTWTVILLGAEITAILGIYRVNKSFDYKAKSISKREAIHAARMLKMLSVLWKAQSEQQTLTIQQLTEKSSLSTYICETLLDSLQNNNLVAKTTDRKWVLIADLRSITLEKLLLDFGYLLEDAPDSFESIQDCDWFAHFKTCVSSVTTNQHQSFGISLDELFHKNNT